MCAIRFDAQPMRLARIAIRCECSSIVCRVHWKVTNDIKDTRPFKIRISICGSEINLRTELSPFRESVTIDTIPGLWYRVQIEAISEGDTVIAYGCDVFKSVFSAAELQQLYAKAVLYCGERLRPFNVLYRCKPISYFDNIRQNKGGLMEPYTKDKNGQAANPLNGAISGLFFMGRLSSTYQLPPTSPFGDCRLTVPAASLLMPREVTKLYFADFYCNTTAHYVTVVCCRSDSDADRFCQRAGLIELEPTKNPFLRITESSHGTPTYYYWVAENVWVELFYTESVPLCWCQFSSVRPVGAGSSTIGGLPHNKHCQVCNLYPQPAISPPPPISTYQPLVIDLVNKKVKLLDLNAP